MTRARGASPPLVSITCVHTRAHRSLASPTSSSRGFSQPCTIVETLSSFWTIPDTHSHTRSPLSFSLSRIFPSPFSIPVFRLDFERKRGRTKVFFFFFFSLCSIFRVLSSFCLWHLIALCVRFLSFLFPPPTLLSLSLARWSLIRWLNAASSRILRLRR